MQYDRAIDLSISCRPKKSLMLGVRIQNARQFAPAIESDIKSIQRSNAAAVQHLRPALAQICLAPGDQFRSNRGIIGMRHHHRQYRCANLRRDRRLVVGRPKSRVCKSDSPIRYPSPPPAPPDRNTASTTPFDPTASPSSAVHIRADRNVFAKFRQAAADRYFETGESQSRRKLSGCFTLQYRLRSR